MLGAASPALPGAPAAVRAGVSARSRPALALGTSPLPVPRRSPALAGALALGRTLCARVDGRLRALRAGLRELGMTGVASARAPPRPAPAPARTLRSVGPSRALRPLRSLRILAHGVSE